MIEELLDNYSTDEHYNLLIDIIKHMKEREEIEKLEEEENEDG